MKPELRPRPHQHDNVVTAPIARIVADSDGGWLIITHKGHAWLHGDRFSAIQEKKWLDRQWWPR
jgi:hypothetical protein